MTDRFKGVVSVRTALGASLNARGVDAGRRGSRRSTSGCARSASQSLDRPPEHYGYALAGRRGRPLTVDERLPRARTAARRPVRFV